LPLHEAEHRIKRIEDLFGQTDLKVGMAVADVLRRPQLTRRQQRKALGVIHGALDGSLALARPQVAALLRLAYLRAARERLGQEFRMGKAHEELVEDMITYTMIFLNASASAIHHIAVTAMRQHLLHQVEPALTAPLIALPLTFSTHDGATWSLQHYAGAVVRCTMGSLIESAAQAEALDPEYAA